jgi:hypothetical protein
MLKTINLKTTVVALALGGLIAATSQAGTEVKKSDGKASKNVIEETKKSCITGDLGVNFVSEYISRGLVYQNQGVIAQPYSDIYFRLYSGDGVVNSVQLQLGVWSSLNSQKYPGVSNGSLKNWMEFDYTAAVAVTFLKNWTTTFSYIEADYPGESDSVDPNRNLQLGLAFNDSDYLGAFALHPHFNVLYEMNTTHNGAAGITRDTRDQANPDSQPYIVGKGGWYYEIGLAPTYTFLKDSQYPITATLPITVGLGDQNGFYAGNTFGYFTTGLNVSVPLAFVPSCFGAWTTTAGFNYYRLGNTAAAYSGSGDVSSLNVTGGSANQWVFSGGIGMTF